MSDLERALSDIADIRNQIAQTKLFRGFGPVVIGATGVMALLLAGAQSVGSVAAGPEILRNWLILAVFSLGLIGCEMWALSKRAHGATASTFVWAMVEKFVPAILAGGAIGWVVLSYASDTSWILPGLWQILISLALFAALPMLPRRIALVAGWYFLTGVAVLLLAAGQQDISPWFMGLPFGLGQLGMAALLHWTPGKRLEGQ